MKKIVFLSGTRADFGKIKSLIQGVEDSANLEAYVFVTGMHLLHEYGYTLIEIERCKYKNIHTFNNHTDESTMDLTLGKTIQGFSEYISKIKPDLIVIHGDRVEALAGAIVGALNNILVAHIEGGEVSGTIDELIRHSTSKMSHIHFVANKKAKQRLIQMGEIDNSVFTIGSPDIDVMFSENLPTLNEVKNYYEIPYQDYAIVMFHPITTEVENIGKYANNLVSALLQSNKNYVVIYPNNDLGSKQVLESYKSLRNNVRFKIFPSLRFEYFLTLLKNAQFIIGNSSAGIREAPCYGVPTINIGTRQANRSSLSEILNVGYKTDEISNAIKKDLINKKPTNLEFGLDDGDSTQKFLEVLNSQEIWSIDHQKQFIDIN